MASAPSKAAPATPQSKVQVQPDAAGVLLAVEGVSLRFGGVTALTDVSFDIRKGEIRAIIGPNGAGKSSMLNVINGFYHPQEGQVTWKGVTRRQMRPHDAAATGIARTFQNIALFKGMTTLDNIMTGRILKMKAGFLEQMIYWGRAKKEELAHREDVEKIIDFLEIQAVRNTPVGKLPYGLQKRVELARALAAEPELLLLDEPMAGMNLEEKEDMCRFVIDVNKEFGTTVALIEHDMGVVMDISDRVVVLDYGKKLADGTPDEVRNNPAVIEAYLGSGGEAPLPDEEGSNEEIPVFAGDNQTAPSASDAPRSQKSGEASLPGEEGNSQAAAFDGDNEAPVSGPDAPRSQKK